METTHLIVKLKLLLSSGQDSMPEKVHYSNPRLCVPKAALSHHSALFNVGILMMDMSGNPAGGNRLASGPKALPVGITLKHNWIKSLPSQHHQLTV